MTSCISSCKFQLSRCYEDVTNEACSTSGGNNDFYSTVRRVVKHTSYEEAAELTPGNGVLSSPSLATLHRVGSSLALSE